MASLDNNPFKKFKKSLKKGQKLNGDAVHAMMKRKAGSTVGGKNIEKKKKAGSTVGGKNVEKKRKAGSTIGFDNVEKKKKRGVDAKCKTSKRSKKVLG